MRGARFLGMTQWYRRSILTRHDPVHPTSRSWVGRRAGRRACWPVSVGSTCRRRGTALGRWGHRTARHGTPVSARRHRATSRRDYTTRSRHGWRRSPADDTWSSRCSWCWSWQLTWHSAIHLSSHVDQLTVTVTLKPVQFRRQCMKMTVTEHI